MAVAISIEWSVKMASFGKDFQNFQNFKKLNTRVLASSHVQALRRLQIDVMKKGRKKTAKKRKKKMKTNKAKSPKLRAGKR